MKNPDVVRFGGADRWMKLPGFKNDKAIGLRGLLYMIFVGASQSARIIATAGDRQPDRRVHNVWDHRTRVAASTHIRREETLNDHSDKLRRFSTFRTPPLY